MIPQSKYFTPPLTRADRDQISNALGLSELEFLFFEIAGPVVLRALNVKGNQKNPLLSPTLTEELKKAINGIRSPVLLFQHAHAPHQLDERSVNEPRDLFEEIFPFPFNLFGKTESLSHTVMPAAFLESTTKLVSAFKKLEAEMQETELSCLWIQGQTVEIPILFHYVRKKRVRVGTAPSLHGLGRKYASGLLTTEVLRETFGTDTSFFPLDTRDLGSSDVILGLSQAVDRLFGGATGTGFLSGRGRPPVTEFRL